jgi:spermidine synthase
VGAHFAELDFRRTALGELVLRRRRDPVLGIDVYEVKLGDEFLMSSAFTVAEVALSRLGLDALAGDALDVAVGGLGLGHTARAAADDARVRSLVVVEALPEVVEWHRRGLLPGAERLTTDPRVQLVAGDFFDLVHTGGRLDPENRGRRFHAVLVDIDHSPRHVLHPSHARFYGPEGLSRLATLLHPGGVFALWSDDPPDEEFGAALAQVFTSTHAHVVEFDNPYTGGTSANTVYVATLAG